MAFKIESKPELLHCVCSGQLTTEDLKGLAEVAEQFERLDNYAPLRLVDMSQICGATIGFAEVEALAARRTAAKLKHPIKTAIAAPSQLQYGLARVFQSLNGNPKIEVQVFHTLPEAEEWLLAVKSLTPH